MKENSKKLFGLLLSLTMLFSILPTASVAGYSDTANHWAETAIGRWSDYGVVEGYGNAFNPDNAITRAQMATILSKTLGLTQTAENPFEDVSEDSWYAPYILQCYKAGIMLGSDGKANPDDEITRQEAMTMFCRAFNINAVTDADLSVYSDESEIADWAFPYVSALINRGIVSGVTSDTVAPKETMSRASLVTILDRAVVQYIQTSGEYELAEEDGIILVAAGDVTLTGKTASDIMITEAADGKELTFKDAVVTGNVTVKADAKIINDNSTLPEIDATVENKKQTPKRTGGSSGGSRPSVSNLTIDEEKTVSSGTYNNVTITDAVGDGEVTIENVTVKGDLTINGGGSNSVKLINCTIKGKVIMAKETGERPRLELTNTPVTAVDVQKPAIIEAADNASAVSKIEATANIEIKGENTKVSTVTIPETAQETVNVTVTAGNVATVEAKAETTVAGAADSVNTIVATAAVTADSSAVQKVEIPETATESVTVTVTGTDAVDVEVNAASGVAVTGENVTVSTTLETVPENITVGGGAVTHIHKWGVPETTEPTCQESGQRVYTCIAEGCEDTAITKTEVIPALGHNYGEWKLSDDDLHVRECANNKNHYDKADHTWDEGKVTTEANCGKEGVKTYTCPVCKGTRTETIEKPAHNWGDWVKVDADTHKRICKNDRKHIETEDHTPIIDEAVPATCTETGKTEGSHCDICNSVIVEQTTTPALKHDFTGEYEKDADGHWHICDHGNCEETDTKAGHTYDTTNCAEVATCTVCGYEKPAGEHTWGDWEKVDDNNHKHTCSCSATETEEHKWDDGKITTEPTETKEGVKTYTCSECKGTKTESVPVLSAVQVALVQDGNSIKATWTGTTAQRYAYCWKDQNGISASLYYWTDEGSQTSYDLAYSLPRLEADSSSYDFVLYEITDNKVGSEIARLKNAVVVTIADAATDYEIAFNDLSEGMHTVTFNETPTGLCYIDAWYRDNTLRSTGYSDITLSFAKNYTLQNGDIYDLRLLTNYALEGQTIKAAMTPPSKKTYAAVTEKNIWFSESQYGYPLVEWTPFELADGEMYVCNDMEWFENSGYLYFELLNIEESGYIPITISKGTWDNKTPLYTENEAVHATITDTEQNLSLVEESDGRYKITSHLNNFDAGCFVYQVRSKNGNLLTTGFTTGKITVSPCDNIEVVVRQVKWTISADKKQVEYTITPLYEITTYTDTQTQTEDTYVSTYEELKAALNKGGVVKLNADIQTTSMLTLNTGDPAVLDLNGHTLDIPRIETRNGKNLTINQITSGSSLINSNGTQEVTAYYGDLTLNGGTYEKIGSQWANNITLNGIVGSNNDYSFYYGKNVSITDCTFGNDSNASRINIWEAENANIVDTALYGNILFSDVNKAVIENITITASYDAISCQTNTNLEIKNVKATAESETIRVHSGCSVTIDGGEYEVTTSYSNLMYMIDGPSVTIKDGKFTGGKTLVNPSSAGKGTLNISGGDFTYYTTALLGKTMTCNISGGSFGYDISEYIEDACTCTNNGDGTYTVFSSEANKK